MSPKLLVCFLVLVVLALSVQAGGKKHKGHSHESKGHSNESKSHHSKSKEHKSSESKEHSKSKESKSKGSKSSESNSNEDCDEPLQKCGPNEEWNSCGTACPLTCDKPQPMACIKKCVAGCQCKKGLLRNKWGKCVEPCDC